MSLLAPVTRLQLACKADNTWDLTTTNTLQCVPDCWGQSASIPWDTTVMAHYMAGPNKAVVGAFPVLYCLKAGACSRCGVRPCVVRTAQSPAVHQPLVFHHRLTVPLPCCTGHVRPPVHACWRPTHRDVHLHHERCKPGLELPHWWHSMPAAHWHQLSWLLW